MACKKEDVTDLSYVMFLYKKKDLLETRIQAHSMISHCQLSNIIGDSLLTDTYYIFLQPLYHRLDVTQGQFLSIVCLV